MKKGLVIFFAVVLLLAGWIFGSYNGVVTANENVNGNGARWKPSSSGGVI